MASNDPELKDGFNLPIWMKTKPTKEFEPFAASPPPAEDSFFFIRYPKKETILGQKTEQELPNILKQNTTDLPSATYNGRERDWSRHTKPCQEVIHGIAPINTAVDPATKPKSAGIDDGFKGEGAACGSSVLKVAHQMVSRGSVGRGFEVAEPEDEMPSASYMSHRRGSRSLPASPPGSPNSRRKKNGNRYFTSPFEPVGDGSGRSWLTMALLGFKKDLNASTSTLAEEDALEIRLHGGTLAQSVECLGPAPCHQDARVPSEQSSATQQPQLAKPASAFRPKPTELREMNFWSPTSM